MSWFWRITVWLAAVVGSRRCVMLPSDTHEIYRPDMTVPGFGHQAYGSVAPDNDFAMQWEVDGKSKKRVDEIAKACR